MSLAEEKRRESKRKWSRNHPEVLAKAAKKQENNYKRLTVRLHKEEDRELISQLENYCQNHSLTVQEFIKNLIENNFSKN
ncbi:MAG: hypothetical protein QNJ54_23535 [Prochloraceae cyanobacterium]|nr:hypothetical protein [Prochloraceae cyanobacterium]